MGTKHETLRAFQILLFVLETLGGQKNYLLFCRLRLDYFFDYIILFCHRGKKTLYALHQ